ncbi:peptidase inhibitor family I36 protein [Kitasatospora sp. NPDC098663]|uniref:peptidase inhibitor family I36 protein n=1 Tax=Kitasatospora sp. NPDC098663 TaxID=3364096 RepID=UPI003830E907
MGPDVKRARSVRLMVMVGAAAAVLAAPLLGAAPAQAAEQCGAGQLCVWNQPEGQGAIRRIESPAFGTCYIATTNTAWSDGTTGQARTVHNLTGHVLNVFKKGDCTGTPDGRLADNIYANLGDGDRAFQVVPDCDTNSICFWPNSDFTGTRATKSPGSTCDSAGDQGGRSVVNNSGAQIRLYASPFCLGGVVATVPPAQSPAPPTR